ncbi:MAG: outer membrane protein assembly factor BamE [Gemmataceae bacterium]|nr:outer membrane protein assembly factor BamE [Gemmataceae bacterium]
MRRVVGLAVVVAFAAGCGGKLNVDAAQKVRVGMTESEVEALLGRGSEATDDDKTRVRTAPGFTGAEPLTFRSWGDAKTRMTVAYHQGKVHFYSMTSTDPKEDFGLAKQQEEFRKGQDEYARGRAAERRKNRADAAPARASDDPGRWATSYIKVEMERVADRLKDFAGRHDGRLPKDLAEFVADGRANAEELDLLKSGDYAAAWGGRWAKGDTHVVVYERAAAESVGLVYRADKTVDKRTKEQLDKELKAAGR